MLIAMLFCLGVLIAGMVGFAVLECPFLICLTMQTSMAMNRLLVSMLNEPNRPSLLWHGVMNSVTACYLMHL